MGKTERLLLSLGMDSEHDGYKKAVAILRILIDGGDRAADYSAALCFVSI